MMEEYESDTEIVTIEQLKKNGLLIRHVVRQTIEKCLIAVKQNGEALRFVRKPNEDIYLAAVKQNGLMLKFIKKQNNKLCMAALKQNAMALDFIKFQEEEMILYACKKNPFVVTMIKKPTEELYYKIFNFNTFKYMDGKIMSKTFINNLWNEIITKDGLLLEKCPFQTFDICKIAINQNPWSIKFVNNNLFDLDQIKILNILAVKLDGMVIQIIKEPDFYMHQLAIAQNKNVESKIKNKFLVNVLNQLNKTCAICYEDEIVFTMYKCYHYFCGMCAHELHKCPSCRGTIDDSEYIVI